MSQHDFNIANQSFPATRTDINDAILAIVSNSSGDTEPSTTYANQWWYETDTNILKIRNEANNGWVDVITLDASMTASASELNQLDAITRGSIIYGNASGATARLAAGGASTVLTSDGTDISWAEAGGGGLHELIATSGAISNAASVVFANQFDSSKYDHYLFILTNVMPVTSSRSLYCHTSTDAGSSYATTYGDYHRDNNADQYGLVVASGVSNTSPSGCSGRFELYSPLDSSTNTHALTLVGKNGADSPQSNPDAGYLFSGRNADEVNNAVRFSFFAPNSNIASGEIAMYGIKKA